MHHRQADHLKIVVDRADRPREWPLSLMRQRDEPAAFLTLLVIGLLAAQLAILALAACPSLHMWLHHDADQPDHQCAVTAVVAGQLDIFVATVVTFLPFAVGFVATRMFVRVPRPFFGSYILEHAPPVSVSRR
jgi:hypothetical protein